MKEKIKKIYHTAGGALFTIGGILAPALMAGMAEDNGVAGWPFFVFGYALVLPFVIKEYQEWRS